MLDLLYSFHDVIVFTQVVEERANLGDDLLRRGESWGGVSRRRWLWEECGHRAVVEPLDLRCCIHDSGAAGRRWPVLATAWRPHFNISMAAMLLVTV